jgi:hypothetical protein
MKNLQGFVYVIIPMAIILGIRGGYVSINAVNHQINNMVSNNAK